MPLSKDQQQQLGSEHGPLSRAQLAFESIILKTGSQEVIMVHVKLNPLTYDIVKANLKHFKDDHVVKLIIKESKLQKDGHYTMKAFSQELAQPEIAEQAHSVLSASQEALVRMHKFVMGILSIPD